MGVCANARSDITKLVEVGRRAVAQLGWAASLGFVACVSTSIPEPAHGSPLSANAEAAPVMPVATSLTHDPLATLPPAAQHDHAQHHHASAVDRAHAAPSGPGAGAPPADHAVHDAGAMGAGDAGRASDHAAAHGGGAASSGEPAAAGTRESPQPAPRAPAADGGKGPAAPVGADVYVCPMHPDVRQSSPGTCPRCGMKLVPAPKPAPPPTPKPQPHEHHAD